MVKVEIDVDQILTCAVALEADVGDKVMVLNGVIIGVAATRRRAEETAPRPPPAPVQKPTQPINWDMVLTLLRECPMTVRQIGDRLRLTPKEREQLKRVVGTMKRQNIIAATDDRRFPAYKLVIRPIENQSHNDHHHGAPA